MVSFWVAQFILINKSSLAFLLTERITSVRQIKNEIPYSFNPKPHYKYSKTLALSNRSSTIELKYNLKNITVEDEKKNIMKLYNDDDVLSIVSEQISRKQYVSMEKLSDLTIFILGASALTLGIGNILTHFEIVQTWRYFWPLFGCLYVWDGIFPNDFSDIRKQLFLSSLFEEKKKNSSTTNQNEKPSIRSFVLRAITVACGCGLIVGGAYDAFMPVWMTGPNVFTNAGIHQDSAMILFFLSIFNFFSRKLNYTFNDIEGSQTPDKQDDSTVTLLQMLLLAQLYLLSESAIDEILTNTFAS